MLVTYLNVIELAWTYVATVTFNIKIRKIVDSFQFVPYLCQLDQPETLFKQFCINSHIIFLLFKQL